jgi:hypothetical protein
MTRLPEPELARTFIRAPLGRVTLADPDPIATSRTWGTVPRPSWSDPDPITVST